MTPPLNFLQEILHPSFEAIHTSRPHVTLTYAQSLDGCISGKGGKQLRLSSEESMVMAHWMRSLHDAILVGIGTAVNDDPQLNSEHHIANYGNYA